MRLVKMDIELYHGDIMDLDVDVLICSANVSLNLSGGVGGALMEKYGSELQTELHSHLPVAPPRFAKQGDVIVTRPANVPYRAVLHAVAVDPFYSSDVDIISEITHKALELAAREKAVTVALAALATGFGDLSVEDFAKGLRSNMDGNYHPIERVVVALQSAMCVDEIKGIIPEATVLGTL
ncbi:MAG: Appr-1-p processing protein [Lysobacterales bacterium]|nr:MAG: Appr-1-p processing protein [Xanthomonadales bacterium]